MVEQFEITNIEAKKLWDKLFGVQYDVRSLDYFRKQKGVMYKVDHRGDDTWYCNCPSFKFDTGTEQTRDLTTGKMHNKTCKHIRFIMKQEGISFKRTYRRV